MTSWTRGLLSLGLVVVLVGGGLGWLTHTALRMEHRQREADAEHEFADRLSRAMWRLDARLAPSLAREESRPFAHYSALVTPPTASVSGRPARPGEVQLPSPLLSAELPEWMLLHFQSDPNDGWRSPQTGMADRPARPNQAAECDAQLADLRRTIAPEAMFARVADQKTGTGEDIALPPPTSPASVSLPQQLALNPNNDTSNYRNSRGGYGILNDDDRTRARLTNTVLKEGQSAYSREDQNYTQNTAAGKDKRPEWRLERVRVGSLRPMWLPDSGAGRLVIVRPAWIGEQPVCQGVLLDWQRLRSALLDEVRDLFPDADLVPTEGEDEADRTMTTLPARFEPGLVAVPADPGWTPLRIGLASAWVAALVALLAVALGGWSLLDLSERRIRFVSAVTHELRTPLTTLRLYLDMLTGGLIRDERQQAEYLVTLSAETERLQRLVGNVLDFARLEKQRPTLRREAVPAGELVRRVSAEWQTACEHAGKRLETPAADADGVTVQTDASLVGQILGTLIDNACKHARGSADPMIRLRSARQGGWLLLEVEDGGPGVPTSERGRIFRPFRRGDGVTAGGVGLGLALAWRWARLLGGRLSVVTGTGGGACFRLHLPIGG